MMRSLSIGLLFFLFSAACAPSLRHQQGIEKNLLSHQYAEADRLVEKNKDDYGRRNIVLYFLDRGMLLHLAGRYRESNTFFEKAGREIERLYTQSVVTHVGALLTNDNLLPYQGEDFETVLIHLFSALNYAVLGEWDEALVEARRVDARLNLLNDRYVKKNVYKKDAFARYLSGILYETRGEVNDAFIAYRKSYDAFKDYKRDYRTPIPSRLGLDLLRVTDDLHLDEEFNTYKKIFPQSFSKFSQKKNNNANGEIVVLAYAGRSPVKEDFFMIAPIPDGDGGRYLLSIAMPKFVPHPSRVSGVEIVLRKNGSLVKKRLALFEDITSIAKKDLEDRVGRIAAKAIARATSKYWVTRAARRKARAEGGAQAEQLIGLLGNIFQIATEQSDKRSWRTLPGKIYMARVSLPEGEWEAEIRYEAAGGLAEIRRVSGVTIKNNRKTFVIVQTAH